MKWAMSMCEKTYVLAICMCTETTHKYTLFKLCTMIPGIPFIDTVNIFILYLAAGIVTLEMHAIRKKYEYISEIGKMLDHEGKNHNDNRCRESK